MDMILTLKTVREVVRAYPECKLNEDFEESVLEFKYELSEKLFNFFESISDNSGISTELYAESLESRYRKRLPINRDNYTEHLREKIDIKVKFSGNAKVYKNWGSFLKTRSGKLEKVDSCYIMENDFLYSQALEDPAENDSNAFNLFKNYLKLCDLFCTFKDLSDYVDLEEKSHINELIFIHKSKISLPVAYDEKYLAISTDCIDLFLEVMEDNTHLEQKKSILKEALYLTLNKIDDGKDKLNYLFSNFLIFYKTFRENYDLFVSEFSFEDVRKEYEEEKRKYLKEINDGMGDVQTKMLGIPLACAASAIKLIPSLNTATGLGSTLFIVFAIFTYGLYLYFTIENERNSLKNILEEYESHFYRLKHQHADQYQKVEHLKTQLDGRWEYQDNCLVWFSHFSIIFCLASTATIFYFHFAN